MTRQLRRLAERKPWKVEPRKTRFAGEVLTWKLDKHIKNENGDLIISVNKRSMMKKAYKAFQKGKSLYRYKNEFFIVPRFSNETDKTQEE